MFSATSTLQPMPTLERLVFEHSAEGMLFADILGEVQLVNKSFLHAFGLREDEKTGAWKKVFGSSDSADEFQRSIWRSLESTGEWKGLMPADKVRIPEKSWFLSVSVIRSEAGEWIGYFALAIDFTERIQVEAQIARNDKSTSVGEGALAVVRGIKNPLQDILMNISVLEIYANDEILGQHWTDAERATIHIVNQEAHHLESVVKGVLNYVRTVELQYEEVPISEFLEDIQGLLQAPAKRRNVHLTIEPDRLNLRGHFDPVQMQHAVLGLLQDAVEAAEQSVRPSILLRAQEKKDPSWRSISSSDRALVFEILGSGRARCGMAQKELFHPCFSGTDSGAARNLVTSAKIIRQHHGLLDIQPAGIQPFSTMYTIALPM